MAATEAVHHDVSRAAVPSTALGVAMMRCWEHQKPKAVRLVDDPYAAILCGTERPEMIFQAPEKELAMRFHGQAGLLGCLGPVFSSIFNDVQ